jgi:hypothetical protein
LKISINLSSEPFRRDRPWVVATIALSSLLIVTLAALTYLAVAGRDEALDARLEVQKAREQLDALTKVQTALQQQLYQPQNAEVIERSVFLNKLLLRKGISWTRIFSDLEKVVPYKVRIIQVRPAITANNEVYLEMDVAAQTSEPVIDMLMRMESSEQFGATHVATWLPPSQTEPMYRYRVNVNYAQKF